MQPTLGFQRVLQLCGVPRAVERPQGSLSRHVLVAIFGEKQSQAVYLLGLQDVGRLDVVNYVSHGVPKIQEAKPESDEGGGRGARRRREPAPRRARSIR